jgi:hypothetical protein
MKQSSAQALGRKGERWFQAALPKEWLFQKPSEDFGIDGTVTIATPSSITPLEFAVQIKTSQEVRKSGNHLMVRGIRRDHLVYWASRLVPTMIVFYDARNDAGYYGWVPSLSAEFRAAIDSEMAVKGVRLSVSSKIDAACWDAVQKNVQEHRKTIASAFTTATSAAAMLPAIHALAECLHTLHRVLSFFPLKDAEAAFLCQQLEIMTHMEVPRIISRLLDQKPSEAAAEWLLAFQESYKEQTRQFFTLPPQPEADLLIGRINYTKLGHSRPALMLMLSEAIKTLSITSASSP